MAEYIKIALSYRLHVQVGWSALFLFACNKIRSSQFEAHIYIDPLNPFLASSGFCCLLITFANSLNPDQDQQNVGPDLDPKCLAL